MNPSRNSVFCRYAQRARMGFVFVLVLSVAPIAEAAMEDRAKEAFRELQLGYVALDRLDLESAIDHYSRARDLSVGVEQRYNALFGMGSAALELGRLDEAREVFDEAHELKPDEVGATYMLGVTCRRQGELNLAVTYLAEAAVRDPDFTQALVELGIAYGSLERHADAEMVCREVLEKDPENVEAQIGLAVSLFHQDENEAALEQFLHVLELDPDNVRAHYGLGLALLFTDDRDGAIQEILFLKPRAPELASDLHKWVFPGG